MFLWNWFTGVLGYLGIWKKPRTLLFLGLDNAGKTTLIKLLNGDCVIQQEPTLYPFSEEVSIDNKKFTAFDLGRHSQALRNWKDYCPKVDAIVFLIDAADQFRYSESSTELTAWLFDEQLADCPVLILGNKVDLPGAASERDLRISFGWYGQTTGKGTVPRRTLPGRPLEIFMCSVLERHGYEEGFRWLAQYLD